MKRQIAIVFLSLFLLANTELHELLRLPMLFSHYEEHLILNAQIRFIDFIVLHYTSSTTENDSDADQDHNLPFKGEHTCDSFTYASVTLPEGLSTFCNKKVEDSEAYLFNYQEFITTTSLSSIWQPPKA